MATLADTDQPDAIGSLSDEQAAFVAAAISAEAEGGVARQGGPAHA